MRGWITVRHQWNFWRGWQNDFDFLRIAFTWENYETARLQLAMVGFEFVIFFRAYSYYELRRRFLEWWQPCRECGGRFGRHDESKEHLPF